MLCSSFMLFAEFKDTNYLVVLVVYCPVTFYILNFFLCFMLSHLENESTSSDSEELNPRGYVDPLDEVGLATLAYLVFAQGITLESIPQVNPGNTFFIYTIFLAFTRQFS